MPRRVYAMAAGQAEVMHAAVSVSAAAHPCSADRQTEKMHAFALSL